MNGELINHTLYSIGHGRRDIDLFIELLHRYKVNYLVDVRSVPQSRFNPQYNRRALENSCNNAGIRYVFMGNELGGRPNNPSLLSNNLPDYNKMAGTPLFREGIERLKSAFSQKISTALVCSESKPEECHRSLLIGKVLLDEGIQLQHIDENGDLKTQEALFGKDSGPQPTLFGS